MVDETPIEAADSADEPAADSERPAQAPSPRELDELERFRDIPIEISVQLDRKRVSMREVLRLQTESVIKLERSAGENVDLLMDGKVVGNGEIVVIEDTMGLRITDLRFAD